MNELNAREGLFAFCAWLTTSKKRTVMGGAADCGKIAYLIEEFSKLNELEDTRPGWENNFTMPKEVQ